MLIIWSEIDGSSISSPYSNYDEVRSAIILISPYKCTSICPDIFGEGWQILGLPAIRILPNETSWCAMIKRYAARFIAKPANHSVDSAIIIAHRTHYGHQSKEAKTLEGSPSDTARAFNGHDKSSKYQSKKSMEKAMLSSGSSRV